LPINTQTNKPCHFRQKGTLFEALRGSSEPFLAAPAWHVPPCGAALWGQGRGTELLQNPKHTIKQKSLS